MSFTIPKRLWHPAFQIGLALALLVLLFIRYESQANAPAVEAAFWLQMEGTNALGCWLALLLMPLNWWSEMQKWHPYIRAYEPMSQAKAIRAMMGGIAGSLFIPFNLGELGGRACFVRPENRWKSALIQGLGGIAQMLVLGAMGLLSGLYIAAQQALLTPPEAMQMLAWAGAIIMVCTVAYCKVQSLLSGLYRLRKYRVLQTFIKDLTVLESLPPAALRSILFWSIFRCGIYATQYVCLVYFFGVKIDILAAYSAVFAIFLVQICLPIPSIAGLLLRGNIALTVWGFWGANDVSILSATALLWIINLLFPAFLGTFSFLFVKHSKTYKHENELA